MFVDEARIQVRGGDGGAGCMSFRREKYRPKGGPDGGSGGRGGDVVLEADASLSTLSEFHYQRHFKATRGRHGQGSDKDGRVGEDLILRVPEGTLVHDADSGERIADLVHAGQRVIVARGGAGGRGNPHFVTPTRRAPAFAEKGEPGHERTVTLELKMLADVALVGLPNAGKSSIIARISHAKPKIADYPFTTLVPNLGVVRAGERSFVVADVPGLIAGASEGQGLGHAFLRHIERTALIVHVVDLSGGYEQRDPIEDIELIDEELERHAAELAERPRFVAGNKLDTEGAREVSERVAAWCSERGVPYFAVSAVTGEGLDPLVLAAGERAYTLRETAAAREAAPEAVYVSVPGDEDLFEVRELGEGRYAVTGAKLERWVVMTDLDNEEAVLHLQRRIVRAGVEEALLRAGARDGDEVTIGPASFEFETGLAAEDD